MPERRRGIGRALAHRLEQTAKDDDRSLILADAILPFDDREAHIHRRFAEACGYELSNYEVVRHLRLPVPDEQIRKWIDVAARHHEGYTIETFVGAVPDHLDESLCVLLGQLAVDAPTGAVDFEEEAVTRKRYAEMVATTAAMGRARYETVASSDMASVDCGDLTWSRPRTLRPNSPWWPSTSGWGSGRSRSWPSSSIASDLGPEQA